MLDSSGTVCSWRKVALCIGGSTENVGSCIWRKVDDRDTVKITAKYSCCTRASGT